jgi:transcriptional regulator with XRE-family HTH domain
MINANLIKKKRNELGLSQVEVVAQVKRISGGLSHSSYVRIETGGAERSKFLPYICQVLQLELSDIDPQLKTNIDMGISSILSMISDLPEADQVRIAQRVLLNLSK